VACGGLRPELGPEGHHSSPGPWTRDGRGGCLCVEAVMCARARARWAGGCGAGAGGLAAAAAAPPRAREHEGDLMSARSQDDQDPSSADQRTSFSPMAACHARCLQARGLVPSRSHAVPAASCCAGNPHYLSEVTRFNLAPWILFYCSGACSACGGPFNSAPQ
jgi:hypothetical protein